MSRRPSYPIAILILILVGIVILACCDNDKRSLSFYKKNRSTFSFAGTNKALSDLHVKQFVKRYIQQNQDRLVSIRQRCDLPFDLMDSIFKRYHLPLELKYLAVIESELKANAVSHVGAVGPWQLMPGTAHILGLKVSSTCDERMSYPRSTQAAAIHLRDLHEEFGDWLLVMAAYNGGEGPVYSAIRQSESRDFWIIQRYLPQETREYVKKFIATYYYFEG
jgi:membrane-bound lytic murein transglycosylase D